MLRMYRSPLKVMDYEHVHKVVESSELQWLCNSWNHQRPGLLCSSPNIQKGFKRNNKTPQIYIDDILLLSYCIIYFLKQNWKISCMNVVLEKIYTDAIQEWREKTIRWKTDINVATRKKTWRTDHASTEQTDVLALIPIHFLNIHQFLE